MKKQIKYRAFTEIYHIWLGFWNNTQLNYIRKNGSIRNIFLWYRILFYKTLWWCLPINNIMNNEKLRKNMISLIKLEIYMNSIIMNLLIIYLIDNIIPTSKPALIKYYSGSTWSDSSNLFWRIWLIGWLFFSSFYLYRFSGKNNGYKNTWHII